MARTLQQKFRTLANVLQSTGDQLEERHTDPHWRVGRKAILLDFARYARKDAGELDEKESKTCRSCEVSILPGESHRCDQEDCPWPEMDD